MVKVGRRDGEGLEKRVEIAGGATEGDRRQNELGYRDGQLEAE